jgi:hypothetical protein
LQSKKSLGSHQGRKVTTSCRLNKTFVPA